MSLITKNEQNLGENEPEKSNPRAEFDQWANQLREVHAMRQKATGRGGFGGGVRWWSSMPEALKVFLLSTTCDDDWERYFRVGWEALPDGLRSAIASECRIISRSVVGCPWR